MKTVVLICESTKTKYSSTVLVISQDRVGDNEDTDSTKTLLLDKTDLSPEQEEASPFTVESLDFDAGLAPSPIAELNKTSNVARAFNTITRDASNSGQKVQENLSSVLRKDLTRRLNSLVLVPSQDRESVITRTPSRSIATSTPFDSANPSPKPPLKNQTPSLSLPRTKCDIDLQHKRVNHNSFWNINMIIYKYINVIIIYKSNKIGTGDRAA